MGLMDGLVSVVKGPSLNPLTGTPSQPPPNTQNGGYGGQCSRQSGRQGGPTYGGSYGGGYPPQGASAGYSGAGYQNIPGYPQGGMSYDDGRGFGSGRRSRRDGGRGSRRRDGNRDLQGLPGPFQPYGQPGYGPQLYQPGYSSQAYQSTCNPRPYHPRYNSQPHQLVQPEPSSLYRQDQPNAPANSSPPPYYNDNSTDQNKQTNNWDRKSLGQSPHNQHTSRRPSQTSSSHLRPILAVPQSANGNGVPFIRGYSQILTQFSISQDDFIAIIDELNIGILPNPEAVIAYKSIMTASYFIPGLGSTIASIGAVIPQIGGALQVKSAIKNCLAQANAKLFNPSGLEVTICSSADLDQFLGLPPNSHVYGTSPTDRLEQYGDSIQHLDVTLPQEAAKGWHDRFAAIYNNNDVQRSQKKIGKKMDKGRGQKQVDQAEQTFKWIVVKSVGDTGCSGQAQQYMSN